MDDERDRPRRRTPRLQSQTERDFEGLKARQERDRQPRRDQVTDLGMAVDGVPHELPDDWDHIDTGVVVTQELEDSIRGDPRLMVLYAKIKHERTRRGSAIMEALGKKPPAERMSAFERTLRRLRWLVVAVAIPAGSSTVLVGKYLMEKSAAEERARIELEQLKAHDVDYEVRIRAVEDIAGKNAQRIDDFFRGHRQSDPSVAPRRDPSPTTRGKP